MEDQTTQPVEPTPEAPAETAEPGLLDRVLGRTGTDEDNSAAPVEVDDKACHNCAMNGKTSQLVDGTCPDCGFVKQGA